LNGFVAGFVRRVLAFDGQALATAKQILNQTFLPNEDQLASTQATFGRALRWPQAAPLLGRARELGLGIAGDFELQMGRRVADL